MNTIHPAAQDRAANIKLLICDVDGVLTDGRIYMIPATNEAGYDEAKVFHARDGHGIKLLQKTGVQVAVISGRQAPMVVKRMQGLGVEHIYQGCGNKLPVFEQLIETLGIKPSEVAYIGDDTIDICVMEKVGFAVAVADAHPETKQCAHWITKTNGGLGAVRELCDVIVASKEQ